MKNVNSAKSAAYAQAAKASRPAPLSGDAVAPSDAPPAVLRLVAPTPAEQPIAAGTEVERDILGTIFESAATTGRFTTLARAIRAAGVAELQWGAGPFTVFAPSDRAFAKLPSGEVDALLEDKPRLTRLLASHVVARDVEAPRANAPTVATAVDGAELTITFDDGGYRVNGARIVKPHLRASNGIVRAIDTVLMPR
jgi:uncharacterized surface protein with fasciclin (FAS1) repeats